MRLHPFSLTADLGSPASNGGARTSARKSTEVPMHPENKPSLRPVDYTREIGTTVCDRLFDGETLFEICRDADMPDKPTAMRWLAQYPEFLDEYVFTGQLLAEDLAAEAVSVADNADTECRKRVRAAKIVTVSGREEFARRRLRLASTIESRTHRRRV
jgi:hypothetical protein